MHTEPDGSVSLQHDENPTEQFDTLGQAMAAADASWPGPANRFVRQEIHDRQTGDQWVRAGAIDEWFARPHMTDSC